MTRADLARWIADYERAWRTAGTDPLADLFTADATYSASPFEAPRRGRDAVAAFWEAEREGPEEVFTLTWEPVAVEADTGVARVDVRYGEPLRQVYRDLWIVTLDDAGRCTAFEEWPFWPNQPRAAGEAAGR